MNYSTLLEKAKSKGKKLLIEKYSISSSTIGRIEKGENEMSIIKEDSSGNNWKCLAILKDVETSKYTENINERIYDKPLWQKVYDEKTAEGTLALADHPEDDSDGSVKDMVAVWHNFKVGKEKTTCDAYLLDNENGRTILRAIEAGGSVGISSVGFGEMEDDDKTVVAETFELVRVGDFVLAPSQQVYATIKNISNNSNSSKEKKESLLKKENTNKKEIIFQKEGKNKMALENIQIANFKSQIRESVKKAEKARELKNSKAMLEAYDELQELEGDIPEEEMSSEKDKVKDELEEMRKALGKTLESKDLVIKSKHNSLNEFRKRYSTALNVLRNLKKENAKLSKYKEFYRKNSSLIEGDFKMAFRDIRLMEKDLRKMKAQRKNVKENIASLLKDRRNLLEDAKAFLTIIERQKQKINSFMSSRGKSSSKKESKMLKKLTIENIKLRKKLKEMDGLDIGHSSTDEYNQSDIEKEENEITGGGDIGYNLDPSLDFQNNDPSMGLVPEPPAEILVKENGRKKVVRVSESVSRFYKEERKKYPALKTIEKEILISKSLIEAVRLVDSFKNAAIKVRKNLNESTIKKSGTGFTDFSKGKASRSFR